MASRIDVLPSTFFTNSPKIVIEAGPGDTELALRTLVAEEANPDKGLEMNPLTRPASKEERNGHLQRLKGVMRMDLFIKELNGHAKLFHSDRVRVRRVSLKPVSGADTRRKLDGSVPFLETAILALCFRTTINGL